MEQKSRSGSPTSTGVTEFDHALVILRTPLQARLSLLALSAEAIPSFDVLYLSRKSSEKDLHYFDLVSKNARKSAFLMIRPPLPSIISNLILAIKGVALARAWGGGHRVALVGSIDSLAITLIAKQLKLPYITVDDGAANIEMASFFYTEAKGIRPRIYRKLLGMGKLDTVREKIIRHYTIFPNLPNIVGFERIRALQPWVVSGKHLMRSKNLLILVGTAEETWMSKDQVSSIIALLRQYKIDLYLPHPVEARALLNDIPRLNGSFEIAEDAILKISKTARVHLIGAFSTVFLTTAEIAHRRTVLIPKGHEKFAEIAKKFGCEIIFLD